MKFSEILAHRFQANYPVIWIESRDYRRVYQVLKEYCFEEDYNLYKWNCVEGLLELGLTMDTVLPVGDVITEPDQVLSEMLRRTDSFEKEIFVLEGLQRFMSRPDVEMLLLKVAMELRTSKKPKHLIVLSSEAYLTPELIPYVDVLDFPECSEEEVRKILLTALKKESAELSGDDTNMLLKYAEGMTGHEASLMFDLLGKETGFGEGMEEVLKREEKWRRRKLIYMKEKGKS